MPGVMEKVEREREGGWIERVVRERKKKERGRERRHGGERVKSRKRERKKK